MTKKYLLLKDLPYLKSGIEYISADGFNGVIGNHSYVPNKTGMKHERFAINIDWIENNPDWFEEIKEKERIEVSDIIQGQVGVKEETYEVGYSEYTIKIKNGLISQDQIPLIKKLLESVLNDEQPKEEGKCVFDEEKLNKRLQELKDDPNYNSKDFKWYDWPQPKEEQKPNRYYESGEIFHFNPQPQSGEFITKEECERREELAFAAARLLRPIPFPHEVYKTFEDYKQSIKQNTSI